MTRIKTPVLPAQRKFNEGIANQIMSRRSALPVGPKKEHRTSKWLTWARRDRPDKDCSKGAFEASKEDLGSLATLAAVVVPFVSAAAVVSQQLTSIEVKTNTLTRNLSYLTHKVDEVAEDINVLKGEKTKREKPIFSGVCDHVNGAKVLPVAWCNTVGRVPTTTPGAGAPGAPGVGRRASGAGASLRRGRL